MSIKTSRNNETFITDSKVFIRNNDTPSSTVVSSSHFKNIFSIGFFKSQKWDQKFAKMGEYISGKLYSIKVIARWFFAIDNFHTAKGGNESVYKSFINALNLKLYHILNRARSSEYCSLRNKETAITVNEASKIDQVFSSDFLHVKKSSSFTHTSSYLIELVMVIKQGIKIHRDRLSEKTQRWEAIVGTA